MPSMVVTPGGSLRVISNGAWRIGWTVTGVGAEVAGVRRDDGAGPAGWLAPLRWRGRAEVVGFVRCLGTAGHVLTIASVGAVRAPRSLGEGAGVRPWGSGGGEGEQAVEPLTIRRGMGSGFRKSVRSRLGNPGPGRPGTR
ncbi:hypothetical protein ACFO4E_03130 [Nocardiopsis mangrovi]|uniref:Uncharacterized protein n=1 Tax=Nocardiopsis mangrovi TaxID=1179818 RepID=A0ABV9DQ01_9ACTN